MAKECIFGTDEDLHPRSILNSAENTERIFAGFKQGKQRFDLVQITFNRNILKQVGMAMQDQRGGAIAAANDGNTAIDNLAGQDGNFGPAGFDIPRQLVARLHQGGASQERDHHIACLHQI